MNKQNIISIPTNLLDNKFCEDCLKANDYEVFDNDMFNVMYDELVKNKNKLKKTVEIENLCFGGGGMKGHGYVGALEILESLGLLKKVKRCAGTSAGSIFAAMVAIGYSTKYIKQQLFVNFNKYLDRYHVTSFFTLLTGHNGLYSGNEIVKDIQMNINKKFDRDFPDFRSNQFANTEFYEYQPTLKDVYDKYNREVIITGTNVNKSKLEYFTPKLTPNMPLYLAIRISMSIPFVFDYVNYNGFVYVDGGLLSNYPIEVFVDEIPENENRIFKNGETTYNKTVGIYHMDNKIIENTGDPYEDTVVYKDQTTVNGIRDFVGGIAKCFYLMEDRSKYKLVNIADGKENGYIDKTISPVTLHLDAINFGALDEEKRDSITIYKICAMKFLKKYLTQ